MTAPSHRYGAPVSRYAPHEDIEPLSSLGDDDLPLTIIGAPPTAIDFNPSGRALANAYVDRVDRAASRLNAAFVAWLNEKWGDVAPDLQKPPTDLERAFTIEWPPWFARWSAARERFHMPEWVFPPPPSEIWMETEQWEKELEEFRLRFVELTKETKIQAPPGPPVQTDGSKGYEEPGGLKQPGLLEGLGVTGALGSIATIVGLVAVAVVGIMLVKR